MARTPEYRPQTRAPRPAQLPRGYAPDMRDGLGRQIAGLGSEIEQGTMQVQAARDRAAEAKRQEAIRKEEQLAITDGIRLESEWQTYADEAMQKAPVDGAGVLEQFDKDWKSVGSHIESTYKTEEGRERAQVMQARIYAATRDRLAGFTAKALAQSSVDRLNQSGVDAGKVVNRDPSRFGAMNAASLALVAELPGLTAQQRADLARESSAKLALAAGHGAATASPYSTLKELSAEKPTAAWAQYLDVDDVTRLRSVAQSEVNRREADARAARGEAQATLRADVADAMAARAMGLPAQLPGRGRFVAAFGAEGAQRYAETSQRWRVYDVVGEAAFQPPAEALATLDKLKPTTQEGAAAAGETYEAAVRLYTAQRKQFEADPVGTLLQRDPQVSAAREAAGNDPQAIERYFATLTARQHALGIMEPKLLPESQRAQIASALAFDPEKPAQRVANLAALSSAYGRNFPAVMREVAPKLDGMARVLVDMAPADAQRLDSAYAQRDTFKDVLPATVSRDITAALQDEMAGLAETLSDDVDGGARLAEHMEAASLYAKSLALRGASPEDAARQAANAVVNGRYTYRDTLRIPRQFDDDAVVAGTRNAQERLAQSGEFQIQPMPGLTPADAQADMRSLVGRAGYWIANEDGTGAVLRIPHRSGLGDVYRADGSRVEYSFADLARAPVVDLDITAASVAAKRSAPGLR